MREQKNDKQQDSMTPQRTRRSGQRLTAEEKRIAQEKFLKSFSNTANVRAACMAAGISRNTVYAWQEHDGTFAMQFRQAELDANDTIRGELFRRGVQGYEKPVTSMGKQVYVEDPKNKGKQIPLMERVYSDSLLSLLAKARMPEFREKTQVDVNANVNTNSDQSDFAEALRQLPNDQVAQIKQWLMDAKARQG